MSEFDDFEFREFDRRLSPRLRDAGMPPIVPRLGTGGGAAGAHRPSPTSRSQPPPPLRGRIMRLLAVLLWSWCAYSVAHMVWHVFLK